MITATYLIQLHETLAKSVDLLAIDYIKMLAMRHLGGGRLKLRTVGSRDNALDDGALVAHRRG